MSHCGSGRTAKSEEPAIFASRNTLRTDSRSPGFSRARHPLGCALNWKPCSRRGSERPGAALPPTSHLTSQDHQGNCFHPQLESFVGDRPARAIGCVFLHDAYLLNVDVSLPQSGSPANTWVPAISVGQVPQIPDGTQLGRRHPYSTHSNSVCPFGRFAYHEASLWRIVFSPTWSSGIGVMSLSCTSSR